MQTELAGTGALSIEISPVSILHLTQATAAAVLFRYIHY